MRAPEHADPPTPLTVLFDATRLMARGTHSTPTGIDRVDLAYVEALRSDPRFTLRLLSFDALGPRLIDARHGAQLIDAVLQRWHAPKSAAQSHSYRVVYQWLQAGTPSAAPARVAAVNTSYRSRVQQMLAPLLTGLRASRLKALPQAGGTLYLNTSHGQLFRPVVARWLRDSGIASVFFVHDLIPIEYPEYNRVREPARHQARLSIIARHAQQVLVNSAATQAALQNYLRKHQLRVPPIAVLPLGIGETSDVRHELAAPTGAPPYFVVLGTIEPRKNHQLLLQCWRRMVDADPQATPRLVVIGRRGWHNETVFKLLDQAPALRQHVIECSDLGDHEVASLIRGARAVLAPSFAEGYGLPVAEALALGTPVLASDIAAHREVGGDYVEYLDPVDGPGWIRAIADYTSDASARRLHYLHALSRYQPIRWEKHFSVALPLLRDTTSLP